MAAIASRASKQTFLKVKSCIVNSQANLVSFKNVSSKKKVLAVVLGASTVGGVGLVTALNQSVAASDALSPPAMPWSHNGLLDAYDHASIRRGYQVYKQVCAACHSMQFMRFRNLVDMSHTTLEARAEAEENMIEDGPNDQGLMFKRPGKLQDLLPVPYDNEEAARFANNGAFPPDLSIITAARRGGEDYIFAILMGYADAPAGVELEEGQFFNPYFAGHAIGMAQALYNEIIEYDDGTPASSSQCAKDVCTFLRWSSDRFNDRRKRIGLKIFLASLVVLATSYYAKRHYFTVLKNRKIFYVPKKPKK